MTAEAVGLGIMAFALVPLTVSVWLWRRRPKPRLEDTQPVVIHVSRYDWMRGATSRHAKAIVPSEENDGAA